LAPRFVGLTVAFGRRDMKALFSTISNHFGAALRWERCRPYSDMMKKKLKLNDD
jgi:hypothetical protein